MTRLLFGLVLFGGGTGLIIQSELGNPPWDVLHEGLSNLFDGAWSTVGTWSIIVAFVVLLGWIPLRERLGIGTVLNAIIIGLMMNVVSLYVEKGSGLIERSALMVGGTLLVGVGSGFYIGARLGPGPRDGLMTGIARRGPAIWKTRTVIEALALLVGWMLGGTFGVGTVFFVMTIGPLVHFFLRWLTVPEA
ncbi:MAG: hypothetical protein OEO77_08865 [Acidimicrobiia bacterium]|nr:hypothetical protein [Acidimicrobiia bacterium]